MNRLSIIVFVLSAAATVATANDIPRVLHDELQVNADRRSLVEAELSLQTVIVEAKRSLLEQGHAAPLEMDVAVLRLKEFQCLQGAILDYQGMLDALASGSRRDSPHARRQEDGGQTVYRTPEHSEVVSALSTRIALRHEQAHGRLDRLRAEEKYLSTLLARLRRFSDGSVGAEREIELTRRRVTIAGRRWALAHSKRQSAATLQRLMAESRFAKPIVWTGGTVRSGQQLGAILQTAWLLHRGEALRKLQDFHLELLLDYRSRLISLAEKNVDRPGEIALHERRIAATQAESSSLVREVERLRRDLAVYLAGQRSQQMWGRLETRDHSRTPVEAFVDPILESTLESTLESATIIEASQRRIASLKQLATNDPVFENELQKARLQLAVIQAKQNVQRNQGSSFAVSLPAAESSQLTTLEAQYEAAAKLTEARVALLIWKRSNLAPLKKLGYATWNEVALAERDLAVAKAQRQHLIEMHEIAAIQLERTKVVMQRDQRRMKSSTIVRSR